MYSCLFWLATPSRAHETSAQPGSLRSPVVQNSELNLSAALTARASGSVGQIPYPRGVLISEEARYPESGAQLEAFSIGVRQPLSASTWVALDAGVHDTHHGGGQEHGLELEQVAVVHRWTGDDMRRVEIRLGRQPAAPASWLSWHADNPRAPVAPLMADVLYARHAVDTGVRVAALIERSSLGVAVWNGNAWPATAGQGAVDVTAGHHSTAGPYGVRLDGFVSLARADDRGAGDDDHTHAGDRVPVGFSGDTRTAGLSLSLLGQSRRGLTWELGTALAISRAEGNLEAETRQAALASNVQGGRAHAE